MPKVELHPTVCPICGTTGNASELYPANFNAEAFTSAIFSARRLPDKIRYRIVSCDTCGLVRSDPAADAETISRLYEGSTLDYAAEIPNLRSTYGRYLERAAAHCVSRASLLEIGCGSGFFLEEALARGYTDVHGVEPGIAAVQNAAPAVRGNIHTGIMRPGLFADERFDIVCLFQVLDHIPEPAELLECCLRTLRPGGALLVLNHNFDAVSSRLLGKHSPIVDIEHTFLYGNETLARLVESRGFKVAEAGAAYNMYSLNYLSRLLPLPGAPKRAVLKVLEASGLGKLRLTVPLGNIYLIATKPSAKSA